MRWWARPPTSPPSRRAAATLSPATDVYAVATMLYELLSGQLPFADDGDAMALMFKHAFEQPEPLLDKAPTVPAPVAAVVMSGLATDPAERPPVRRGVRRRPRRGLHDGLGPGWLPADGTPVMGASSIVAATERPSSGPAGRGADGGRGHTGGGRRRVPAPATVLAASSRRARPHGGEAAGHAGAADRHRARTQLRRWTMSTDGAADLVPVKEVLTPPPSPARYFIAAAVLVVVAFVVALVGIGAPSSGGTLAAGEVRVAGTDVVSGGRSRSTCRNRSRSWCPRRLPPADHVALSSTVLGQQVSSATRTARAGRVRAHRAGRPGRSLPGRRQLHRKVTLWQGLVPGTDATFDAHTSQTGLLSVPGRDHAAPAALHHRLRRVPPALAAAGKSTKTGAARSRARRGGVRRGTGRRGLGPVPPGAHGDQPRPVRRARRRCRAWRWPSAASGWAGSAGSVGSCGGRSAGRRRLRDRGHDDVRAPRPRARSSRAARHRRRHPRRGREVRGAPPRRRAGLASPSPLHRRRRRPRRHRSGEHERHDGQRIPDRRADAAGRRRQHRGRRHRHRRGVAPRRRRQPEPVLPSRHQGRSTRRRTRSRTATATRSGHRHHHRHRRTAATRLRPRPLDRRATPAPPPRRRTPPAPPPPAARPTEPPTDHDSRRRRAPSSTRWRRGRTTPPSSASVPGHGGRAGGGRCGPGRQAGAASHLAGLGSEPWGVRADHLPGRPLPRPRPTRCRHDLGAPSSTAPATRSGWWSPPSRRPSRWSARSRCCFGAALPAGARARAPPRGLRPLRRRHPRPRPRAADDGPARARRRRAASSGRAMALSFVRYLVDRAGRAEFLRIPVVGPARPARRRRPAGLRHRHRRPRGGLAHQSCHAGPPDIKTGQFLRLATRYLRPHVRREVEMFVYMLLRPGLHRRVPVRLQAAARQGHPERPLHPGARHPRRPARRLHRLACSPACAAPTCPRTSAPRWCASSASEMFVKMQTLPQSWYSQRQQGDVLSRLFSDVGMLEQGLSQTLRGGLSQILSLVVSAIVLVILEPAAGRHRAGRRPDHRADLQGHGQGRPEAQHRRAGGDRQRADGRLGELRRAARGQGVRPPAPRDRPVPPGLRPPVRPPGQAAALRRRVRRSRST